MVILPGEELRTTRYSIAHVPAVGLHLSSATRTIIQVYILRLTLNKKSALCVEDYGKCGGERET